MSINAIYIRRRGKVILPEGAGTTALGALAALQKNLESLGYLLGREVMDGLARLSLAQVDAFYQRLVKDLRTLVGAHRKFEPMYPNFPGQVMEMTEAELYVNALLHYWTLQRHEFEQEDRPALEAYPPRRIIGLGDRADFDAIFTLLARSKSPFSPQDKQDVAWFIAQYRDDIQPLLPEDIPSRENLAYLGAKIMRYAPAAAAVLDRHVKTATDVLRLAVALSNGDVSLAEAGQFGKFHRAERARMLGWIERAPNRTEDMLRWKPRWIRLGEHLHPREYAKRFPQTAAAFGVLRNNRPFSTFNAQIETALSAKDTATVLDLLDARPGDLARRLDHLARISPAPQRVVDGFSRRAERVSTPVLLQVMTHFRRRDKPADLRVFFPKGEVGKLFGTTRALPALAQGLALEFAAICERALLKRFAALPPLGPCYLDPGLKNYLVPFSQRSASKSLRTLTRGSRLALPEGGTLRFFVWWKNGRGRADIDLSAVMYSARYGYISALTYYNLKDFGGHHSGDIVDAPRGASEFIDVDLALCRARGVRFVVMTLNSFTEQPFCDLPECFAGWMSRQAPASGEIYEPKTVVDKVDIASNTRICAPVIFDLERGEAIWADIAVTNHAIYQNNVAANLTGLSLMLRAMTDLRKTDLYTLFDLHIRARGVPAADRVSAQTVFAVDAGLTPFDLERITAEFM